MTSEKREEFYKYCDIFVKQRERDNGYLREKFSNIEKLRYYMSAVNAAYLFFANKEDEKMDFYEQQSVLGIMVDKLKKWYIDMTKQYLEDEDYYMSDSMSILATNLATISSEIKVIEKYKEDRDKRHSYNSKAKAKGLHFKPDDEMI